METSIIIPARKERYLDQTIKSIADNFGGDYEIIVNKEPIGMRTAINQAVAKAKGKYILKLDAHCMVDKDMDLKLIKEHQPKWVQIPTRKRLIAGNWKIDNSKPDIDYMHIRDDFMGVANYSANRKTELKKKLLDDTEVFQGSCYFMLRDYFLSLGLLDNKNFGGSGFEALEIALKVRENGGRIIRNKNTWYAHARLSRHYKVDRTKSREYIKEYAGHLLHNK